jgi:hypothetical protein
VIVEHQPVDEVDPFLHHTVAAGLRHGACPSNMRPQRPVSVTELAHVPGSAATGLRPQVRVAARR